MLDHPDYQDHVLNCPVCMNAIVKKWMKKVKVFNKVVKKEHDTHGKNLFSSKSKI